MEQLKNRNRKNIIYAKLSWVIIIMVIFSSSSVTASAYSAEKLIPIGKAIGINLEFNGASVVNVTDTSGGTSPAKTAGIMPGDIIIEINGVKIASSADVRNVSAEYDGSPVEIKFLRQGKIQKVKLVPYQNGQGGYELGVWLRDSMSGLGTMTFYDPETGIFGALGHGVSDMDSGTLVPLRNGVIVDINVSEVVEGRPGFPGQLRGNLNFDKHTGTIEQNAENGIFGVMKSSKEVSGKEALPVAADNEIRVGKAVILCDVGYGTEEYEIEISRLYLGNGVDKKNMLLTVTDEKLLSKTGGIVQGMSGSPIIQNGKIVGAVTHVLINNPSKGYGITIGNMLAAIDDMTVENAA